MLSLLACAVLSQAQPAISLLADAPLLGGPVGKIGSVQESNRLRSILPNGAVTWVERAPHADRLIVQLFVSSRSLPNNKKTNGLRHLLEHLSALGRNREIDQDLESRGGFLTAQTVRDATIYQMCLRPGDLLLAFNTVKKIMQLGDISADQIVKEAEIIRQEIALESAPHALAAAAWQAAFGDAGADPLGDADSIAAATPEALASLHQQEFAGRNLTLLISGDVDLDGATAEAHEVLALAPSGSGDAVPARTYRGGGVSSVDTDGEAVACFVDSWNSPKTAARLAAALSIAAGLKDSFVTYTPSLRGSLVVVGRTSQTSGLDQYIGTLSGPGEFGIGRNLAKAWVETQMPLQSNNILGGLLLSEGAGQRPETVLENLEQMTVEQFTNALNAFRSGDAVKVLGK